MLIPLFLSLAMLAQDAPRTYVLNADKDVWDVAVEELTGDKLAEILLLTCDETSYPLEKSVDVHAADVSGAYGGAPTVSMPLAPSISALFFAEVDGTKPRELIAVDASGAQVFHYTAEGFELREQPRFNSSFPNKTKSPLFLKDGALDVNGDGVEEWFIPVASGYELRTVNSVLKLAECDVVSEVFRREGTRIYQRFPAYRTFDMKDQPQKGLAFLSDEFADFLYGSGWNEHQRFKIPVNLEEKWEADASMADINNDGFPDLLVVQTKGTLNLQVQTQVYVATAPFVYPEKPTASFVTKGAIAEPGLKDVNGDKLLDVLLISIPFGLKNFVNLFMLKKVSVDAQVYLFNGKDFGEKPAYDASMSLDAPEGRERVAYTMADFNGDGRLDVAFGQKNDALTIHAGDPDRFVSSKPWVKLELPSFGDARPYDLNGNAAQDIVLFHPAGENAKRVEVIVF